MDGEQGRSALRQPFITTANALASLYKQAAVAERDARDAGTRAAYMHVMQWAAGKARAGEALTVAQVINFCGAEMSNMPPPRDDSVVTAVPLAARWDATERAAAQETQGDVERISPPGRTSCGGLAGGGGGCGADSGDGGVGDSGGGGVGVSCAGALTVRVEDSGHGHAYIARDDRLLQDIRKLDVNPRKRQRIDISDTFMRACEDAGNENVLMEHGYKSQSLSPQQNENQPEQGRGELKDDRGVLQGRDRFEDRDAVRERDGRDTPFIAASANEFSATATRKPRGKHSFDKHRRK